MKILAFDTSTRGLSLAVADGEKILRFRNFRTLKVLSSSIMPSIQTILKSSGWTLKSLDGIIVGLGPGAFTSLRVGISTAKALSFANQIPAVGLSSLDLIAMNIKGDGTICVMNDARRGLVYACSYEKRGPQLKRLSDYLLEKPETVLKGLKAKTIVIGDAVPVYKVLLKDHTEPLVLVDDKKLYFPDARHLVALGLERLTQRSGIRPHAPANDLNPIYLYPDNCQVQK